MKLQHLSIIKSPSSSMFYKKKLLRQTRATYRYHYVYIPLILTTGQTLEFPVLLNFTKVRGSAIKLKADYFSNNIWKMLDQPKVILTLVRFARKFLTKDIMLHQTRPVKIFLKTDETKN